MSYRPFSPSLFGPYRDYYESRLRQLNGPQTTNTQEEKFESTQSEFVKIAETKDKIDFKAFHKKQNVKFFQSQESRKIDRAARFMEDRKEKRNQVLMEKRKCAPVSVTKESVRPITNINEPTGKESRREQLLRWKKEKEAVLLTAKTAAKPPFKAGQTVVSASAKGSLMDNNVAGVKPRQLNPNVRSTTVSAHGNFTGATITTGNIANISKESNGVRRVTRAMTKAQTDVITSSRPPVNKMEKLTLDGKTKAKSTITHQHVALAPASNQAKNAAPNIIKNAEPTTIKNIATTVEVAPAPKKLKPKAIDEVYIQFNSTFSKACETLRAYSEEWKLIVNWPDIPENIREDITCSIGRVKLLLDSKLPQFGQLLYSYLCREADPLPILPCDLQGWWDVASLQLEIVKSQFEKLKQLQKNAWMEEPVNPPVKTIKPLAIKPENKIVNEVKKKPVNASKGIREFLAMKRQLALEPVKSEEKKLEIVGNKTPEKRFEGGFFDVSSPVKHLSLSIPRMSSRLSAIKDSNLTPTRRGSSTNMSLRMLTVRQSMGKIGVIRSEESIRIDALNGNMEDQM